jgi:hypothetical protein
MATRNPTGPSDSGHLTTFDEDDRDQRAVLRQVLELHPDGLTQDELIRELTGGGSKVFSDVDAVKRAVRDLAGTGLFHPLGEDEMVRPTRAAVRYFELSGGGF